MASQRSTLARHHSVSPLARDLVIRRDIHSVHDLLSETMQGFSLCSLCYPLALPMPPVSRSDPRLSLKVVGASGRPVFLDIAILDGII